MGENGRRRRERYACRVRTRPPTRFPSALSQNKTEKETNLGSVPSLARFLFLLMDDITHVPFFSAAKTEVKEPLSCLVSPDTHLPFCFLL